MPQLGINLPALTLRRFLTMLVALGLEHLYVECHAEGTDQAWPLAEGISALPLQALGSLVVA